MKHRTTKQPAAKPGHVVSNADSRCQRRKSTAENSVGTALTVTRTADNWRCPSWRPENETRQRSAVLILRCRLCSWRWNPIGGDGPIIHCCSRCAIEALPVLVADSIDLPPCDRGLAGRRTAREMTSGFWRSLAIRLSDWGPKDEYDARQAAGPIRSRRSRSSGLELSCRRVKSSKFGFWIAC